MISKATVQLVVLALIGVCAAKHNIDTIVVLMLENRSFDHMCGWLKSKNPDINGLTGDEYNMVKGKKYKVDGNCPYVNPFDPYHSYDATLEQLNGEVPQWKIPAPMSGFAKNAKKRADPGNVMQGFSPDRVPTISTLAQEFAIFDEYYASVPGPTCPNRQFYHTGTAHGRVGGYNFVEVLAGLRQRTMYDVYNDNNVSWGAYYKDVSDVLVFKNIRTLDNLKRVKPFEKFVEDAAAGTLPSYSWVSPRFLPTKADPASDQHPDHDVIDGERVIAEVYNALRASPQWNRSALIVTYDEHGGFYDHVSPPVGAPNPDGLNATDDIYPFNFTRLGLRVCNIVASPWVPKGKVVHKAKKNQYDHTSMFATMRNLFGIKEQLSLRSAWADPFDDVFSLSTPRADCPKTMPTPQGDTQERMQERIAEQMQRPPNSLQKEFYVSVEALLGRTPKDPDSFKTQGELGEHIRYWQKQFMDNLQQDKSFIGESDDI